MYSVPFVGKMIEDVVLRSLRHRRSIETDNEHVEVYHETYEFIDTSNYRS